MAVADGKTPDNSYSLRIFIV